MSRIDPQVNTDPLRLILGVAALPLIRGEELAGWVVVHEVLECGHALPLGSWSMGMDGKALPYTPHVKRRRCPDCRYGRRPRFPATDQQAPQEWPAQIVVVRVERELRTDDSCARIDLGERPRTWLVPVTKAAMWMGAGTPADLIKALAYVSAPSTAADGWRVVMLPMAEPEPLEAARRLALFGLRGVEQPDADTQSWCACGRRVSECDGSRSGCRKPSP